MTARLLPLAIAGFLAVSVQVCIAADAKKATAAEELQGAIQTQIANREAMEKKAADAQIALHNWYLSALDAVKKDAISKGDLDSVLASDNERARVDRDLTEEEKNALPATPRAVRDKYDQARAQQAAQAKASVAALVQAYAATLEAMEKRLTQQGELDAAIATRTERAKAVSLLAGAAAPAPEVPSPSSPGPAKPGPAPAAPASVSTISRENPAKIECEEMDPSVIVEGGDPQKQIEAWASFPPEFKGATIYYPKTVKADQSKATVIYKTLAPGRVYAVCNFKDQGNPGGGWKNDRWTEADFLAHGWARVEGAGFVNQKGEAYVVLTKVLTKEDGGRLRSNKYNPPYLVTFAPSGS